MDVLSVNKLVERIKHVGEKDEKQNERGNTIYRWWRSTERYVVDFARFFHAEGWLQFDTSQDAWYFGVWVNPSSLTTLTYAEGDWTVCECEDIEHYNAEISSMCAFYDEGRIALAIGQDGSATEYRQDRSEFLIPT